MDRLASSAACRASWASATARASASRASSAAVRASSINASTDVSPPVNGMCSAIERPAWLSALATELPAAFAASAAPVRPFAGDWRTRPEIHTALVGRSLTPIAARLVSHLTRCLAIDTSDSAVTVAFPPLTRANLTSFRGGDLTQSASDHRAGAGASPRLLLRARGRQPLADAGGRMAMSLRIDVQQWGDEVLVTVHGVVDRTALDVAAGLVGLGQGHASVVVDLRDAVLASPHGVQDLVSAVRDRARAERIALVCDRVAGRRLLRLACGDAAGVRVLRDLPRRAAARGVGARIRGRPHARRAADRPAPVLEAEAD